MKHQLRSSFIRFPIRSLVVAMVSFVALQACTPFGVDPKAAKYKLLDFASTGGSDLQPVTDKVDPQCMNKTEYDACVFRKNPVAQAGRTLGGIAGQAYGLDAYQTYGVKLTGVSPTGRLENDTIKIESATGTNVTTQAPNLKFRAENDGNHLFVQVMTYYWLTRTMEYVEARTGVFQAKNKGIKVYVDDTIAGFSPKTNSIHLKLDDSGNMMAYNADLAIHFFGVATLHHATNGAIAFTGGNSKHRDCGLKTSGCCTSRLGCSRAIESGVGDYFAAMMFPDQPVVGETWVDRADGIGLCSQSRDLRAAAGRSAQVAYDACGAAGAGEISTLGTIYASIWFEVRKAAGTDGAKDIDTLFMQHLPLLNSGDDFQSALVKIKSVDSRLFGGKYAGRFDAQYAARGL